MEDLRKMITNMEKIPIERKSKNDFLLKEIKKEDKSKENKRYEGKDTSGKEGLNLFKLGLGGFMNKKKN